MRIGFLGIQCDNDNLGVSALAYAGLNLVHQVAPTHAEFILFSENSQAGLSRMVGVLHMEGRDIRCVPFRHKSPSRLARSIREIGACDVVIDFSGGDSFSDIYGLQRIVKLLLHKEIAIVCGTSLVLGPQTFGPFNNRLFLPVVRHVVNRAALVFARDELSRAYLASLIDREVVLTTDVAVTLPAPAVAGWERRPGTVGFNVSGLLWRGGYSGNNQFHLRSDYVRYCDAVVSELLRVGLDVELIAHVRASGRINAEDDMAACRELRRRHPGATLGPAFADPVAAKSHISRLELFIGARMHATIAAFSSGIATVPVSYSRKFQGLYGSLGYTAVVDLKELHTEEAVACTMRYVADHEDLGKRVEAARAVALQRIELFSSRLADLIDARV